MIDKYKEVQLNRYESGKKIVNLCFSESNDDWIRAGRISEEAKAGDKESAMELERLDKSSMMKVAGELNDVITEANPEGFKTLRKIAPG